MIEMFIAIVTLIAGLLGMGGLVKRRGTKIKRLEKEIEVAEKLAKMDGKVDGMLSDDDLRNRVREQYLRENRGNDA